jgi:uncharacterized surface protein with fasciclin (FAS1) repeats
MNNPFLRSTISMAILAFSTVAVSADGHSVMVGGAEMLPAMNIIENAMNSADHTTLVAAVKAAGLVDTLQGEGPFTVFAPVNSAFDALPDGTVDMLLKPENKAMLTQILTCHVLAADAKAEMIEKMIMDDGGTHTVTTVGGCKFDVMSKDEIIMIKDATGTIVTVTIADVNQSNGVIYVIDKVLMPAG